MIEQIKVSIENLKNEENEDLTNVIERKVFINIFSLTLFKTMLLFYLFYYLFRRNNLYEALTDALTKQVERERKMIAQITKIRKRKLEETIKPDNKKMRKEPECPVSFI